MSVVLNYLFTSYTA